MVVGAGGASGVGQRGWEDWSSDSEQWAPRLRASLNSIAARLKVVFEILSLDQVGEEDLDDPKRARMLVMAFGDWHEHIVEFFRAWGRRRGD